MQFEGLTGQEAPPTLEPNQNKELLQQRAELKILRAINQAIPLTSYCIHTVIYEFKRNRYQILKGRVLARHKTGYSDTFLVSTTQIGLVSTTYGVSIYITTVLYGCIALKAILLF